MRMFSVSMFFDSSALPTLITGNGGSISFGSVTARTSERSAPSPTKPSMNSGPWILLVLCCAIGNSLVGCSPAGGVNAGLAETVTVCGTHQFSVVNVSGLGPARVCSSGSTSIVTVAVGALVRRTV